MNKKNTQHLYKKYPKIFAQRKLTISESCMPWGFQCNNGWFKLVDILCLAIQIYVKKHKGMTVEAVQVKEKFGGLRFYYDGGDSVIEELVDLASILSYKICETCGTMDNIKQSKGYIYTECKTCRELRGREK